MLTSQRVRANLTPRADISKRNMGIFRVDQAHRKMMILLYLVPFSAMTAA